MGCCAQGGTYRAVIAWLSDVYPDLTRSGTLVQAQQDAWPSHLVKFVDKRRLAAADVVTDDALNKVGSAPAAGCVRYRHTCAPSVWRDC